MRSAHLILTSSKGTTTKLSVAPALEPVRMASSWFILVCPVSCMYVFPQKSFAALYAVLDFHAMGKWEEPVLTILSHAWVPRATVEGRVLGQGLIKIYLEANLDKLTSVESPETATGTKPKKD